VLKRLLSRIKKAIGGYLTGVFRGTEALNREAILEELVGVHAGTLLDCGCGDGSFTAQLAKQVNSVSTYGVEWDGSRVEEASRRGVIAALADLNAGLPFRDASFDVVHSNQVIEHLQATDLFLRETRRVLKPGGLAVLSTNNLASWHNILSLVMGMQPPPMHISNEVIAGNAFDPLRGSRHPTEGDSHLRIFSFKALREICEYHGFDVEVLRSVGYYPMGPRLARLATRVDRWHGAFLVARMRAQALPINGESATLDPG
jgi:methionine biosynthesis protein MetW